MALLVTHQEVVDDSGTPIRPVSWRVAVEVAGTDWVLALPLEFGRQKDAEWARQALVDEGLCESRSLREAGVEKVKRVMLEALRW